SGLRRRSVAGLWVAAGSLIMASGGTLTRFGMTELLPVANSVGVVLLYAGYVIAGVRQMESGIVSEKTEKSLRARHKSFLKKKNW
ncbi:MAG: hypothetical protein LOD92_11255, partial [Bacillales bacterium]